MAPALAVSMASLWPFVHFANANREEVYPMGLLLAYGSVFFILSLTGFFLLCAILRRRVAASRLAVCYATAIILFFSFPVTSQLAHLLLGGSYTKAWAAVTVAALVLLYMLSRFRGARVAFFVYVTTIVLLPAGQYLGYQLFAAATGPAALTEASVDSRADSAPEDRRPPVFSIILDEYGRADTLRTRLSFDNSPFLDELANRGFYVADRATSSFSRTNLSIPTMMAMRYLLQGEITPQKQQAIKRLLNGDGPVFDWFHRHGYFTALLHYNGAYCQAGVIDYCSSRADALMGEFESGLLSLTPANTLINFLIDSGLSIEPRYVELPDAQAYISALDTDEPVFVHIHALVPHEPYRFDESCGRVPFRAWAGRAGRDGYIEQLVCANAQTLALIDLIQNKYPDSVIAVQSDHGARKWGVPYRERFGILSAWRLPAGTNCRDRLNASMVLVNTFTTIIGCLTDQALPLLPPRYFVENRKTGNYEEIDISR